MRCHLYALSQDSSSTRIEAWVANTRIQVVWAHDYHNKTNVYASIYKWVFLEHQDTVYRLEIVSQQHQPLWVDLCWDVDIGRKGVEIRGRKEERQGSLHTSGQNMTICKM